MNTSPSDSVAPLPSPEVTIQNTPEINTPATTTKPTRRTIRVHPSKITELPPDVRTLINESLFNNVGYPKLIALLAEKGHPGFNRSNLSRWKRTGYREWILRRERIESVCLKVDDVHNRIDKFSQHGVDHCDRLNKMYLSAHITQTMEGFNPELLVGDLNEKPGRFYKLARIINTQTLERQRQEKIDLFREKFSSTQPTGPTAAGEQAIRLAFGIPDSWVPAGTRNNVTPKNAS